MEFYRGCIPRYRTGGWVSKIKRWKKGGHVKILLVNYVIVDYSIVFLESSL